jgi:hypothetical protein
MKTFQEFMAMMEVGKGGLWMHAGPQDNPSNPGTRRKDPKDPYNHRFGSGGGTAVPVQPMRMDKK